jgi:hypothetical protein
MNNYPLAPTKNMRTNRTCYSTVLQSTVNSVRCHQARSKSGISVQWLWFRVLAVSRTREFRGSGQDESAYHGVSWWGRQTSWTSRIQSNSFFLSFFLLLSPSYADAYYSETSRDFAFIFFLGHFDKKVFQIRRIGSLTTAMLCTRNHILRIIQKRIQQSQ